MFGTQAVVRMGFKWHVMSSSTGEIKFSTMHLIVTIEQKESPQA